MKQKYSKIGVEHTSFKGRSFRLSKIVKSKATPHKQASMHVSRFGTQSKQSSKQPY